MNDDTTKKAIYAEFDGTAGALLKYLETIRTRLADEGKEDWKVKELFVKGNVIQALFVKPTPGPL